MVVWNWWDESRAEKGPDIPKIINPLPCLLPARTSSGGLSRIEVKFGSSPGCAGPCRRVDEVVNCRRGVALLLSLKGAVVNREAVVGACLGTVI